MRTVSDQLLWDKLTINTLFLTH